MTNFLSTRYHWFMGTRFIIVWILFCSALALFLRLSPLLSGNWSPEELSREPDILYHLRQIELIQHYFPEYFWFEPMTNYPFGTEIHWGPVYSLAGSALSLIAGAQTRTEMIRVVSWLPVLIGILLVPTYYLLGRIIWDYRTGLIAAFFIAILPGMLFQRSIYGYVDHHIAEMLFCSLFCLGYLIGLRLIWNNSSSNLYLGLIGLGGGVAFAIAVAIIPTVITISMVIGLFVFFFALYSRYQGNRQILQKYALFNGISLLPAIIALLLIGIHDFSFSLKTYSIAHILVYGTLICIPFCFVLLSIATKKLSFQTYILVLFGFVIALIIILLLIPVSRNMLLYHLKSLFFVSDIQDTVSELAPWSLKMAVMTYLTGWILGAAGGVICILRFIREKNPVNLFLMIWFFVMLISTVQHWRFEYYLAGPFVLLISIASSDTISKLFLKSGLFQDQSNPRKGNKIRKSRFCFALFRNDAGTIILGICILIFVCWSISEDLSFHPEPVKPDQKEAMDWLKDHSPSPGLNLTDVVSREGFRLPDQSYGILAWWDYGHMITWLAGRIPYANPFQDGAFTAARLLTDTDEYAVYKYLNQTKGRYIITDTPLVSDRYPGLLAWRTGTGTQEPTRMYEVFTDDGGSSVLSTFLGPGYYLSLAPKLHIYDGSDTLPGDVYTIQYEPSGFSRPAKNGYSFLGKAVRIEKISSSASGSAKEHGDGTGTVIGQTDFSQPTVQIPALVHFRLVHESMNQTWSAIARPDGTPYRKFSSVKIFEVVPGVHVSGVGIIEITLKTNTGREFVYRQESRDGEFILPYSTESCSGDICPMGPYRLKSGEEIRVTEQEIQSGESGNHKTLLLKKNI